MDKLILNQLQIPVVIGDLPKERQWPQKVWLDLEAGVDLSVASQSDELNDVVDYVAVTQACCDFTTRKSWRLVETLASQLADFLMQTFKFNTLRLQLTKRPAELIELDSVAVVIERP
ncbi:MAG: dihydroneopterin aldolase [Gammaproteobacteria bacterium]|nr:dihydroneopterin aldolase [Gammaproteobacteria bacterium]